MTRPGIVSLVIAVCLCVLTWSARGYDLKYCLPNTYYTWEDGEPTLYLSTDDWPEDGDIHEALEDLIEAFRGSSTSFPGTDLYLHHGNVVGTPSLGNSQNEIHDKENWLWNPDAPAATRYGQWSNCHFIETDILFNDEHFNFTLDPPGWPGDHASITQFGTLDDSLRSRKAILMHELGHFSGLNHQGGYPDNMNATYPTGSYADYTPSKSSIKFEVTEDAREGLRYLYPDSSTGQDLAISNWRYGYYEDPDEPGWLQCHPGIWHGVVDANYAIGDSIQVWFSYVNLGTDTQEDVRVGIYLSADDTIEASDKRIALFEFTQLIPNTPALVTTTTTIPRGTPSGDYYLGAMIDTTDIVSEYDEGNNTNLCAGSGGIYEDEAILVTISQI